MPFEPPTTVGDMLVFPTGATSDNSTLEPSADIDQSKAATKSVLVPNPAGPDDTLEEHLQIMIKANQCKCAANHKPQNNAEQAKLRQWVQTTAVKVKAAKSSSTEVDSAGSSSSA